MEKWISTALFSTKKNLLEIIRKINPNITDIIPICREAHLIAEIREIKKNNKDKKNKLAGYASGWKILKTDLLIYGKIGNRNILFPIEIKKTASLDAKRQVVNYGYAIVLTLLPDLHAKRAKIYELYLKKILEIKKLSFLIKELKNGNLIIQPLIIYEKINKKSRNFKIAENSDLIEISKGFKEKINELNLRISDVQLYQLDLELKTRILEDYKNLRIKDLIKIYPKYEKDFLDLGRKDLIIKYTNNHGIYFADFNGNENFINWKHSHATRVGDATPKIFEELKNNSGKFHLQFFINGINNPVYYLELENEIYAAFEHRFPNQLSFNGYVNKYIAEDSIPHHTIPEAGEIYCIEDGTYKTVIVSNTNIIKLVLKCNTGEKFETYLISPKVRRADYNNLIRPFLTIRDVRKQIQKAGNNQKQIYDFTRRDAPIIITGIRIF
ncbi:MAG: hypothetical protein ACTSVK_02105 [Promethearchaeota archaeon]